MDILDFRIFVRLAATRNLSQVGAELALTPGTISKRLQAMEGELRTRLFDRTTRAIHITEEGQAFLVHAERVLENMELALQAVGESGGASPRGLLKISASTGFGKRLAAPVVAAFVSSYPDIDIHVQMNDRLGSLANEGVDVAIRNVVIPDSNEIARTLGADPQVLVASPAYLAQRGTPSTPDELARHDCLFIGEASHWTLADERGEQSIRVEARIRSNSSSVVQQVARQGRGILRAAEMAVRSDIAAGRLMPVMPQYRIATQASIYAIYPRAKHMTPRVRAFLDFLSEWFRSPQGWRGMLAGSTVQLPSAPVTPAGHRRSSKPLETEPN